MKIEFVQPTNELLKNHIDFFYFLNRSEDENDESYLVFPDVGTHISLFVHSELVIGDFLTVKENKSIDFDSAIDNNNLKPAMVKYVKSTNEICIKFKALGINNFLSNDLEDYLQPTIAHAFFPYDDFKSEMLQLFAKSSHIEKQAFLEQYLVSKYKKFEHPFLMKIISEINEETNENININQLAKKYNITPKTLIKHFKKHIGVTPNYYKKIVRFRNTINKNNATHKINKITDLVYSQNYFDQSHMIKDFKSLTGQTPKDFFKKLTSFYDGKRTISIL